MAKPEITVENLLALSKEADRIRELYKTPAAPAILPPRGGGGLEPVPVAERHILQLVQMNGVMPA